MAFGYHRIFQITILTEAIAQTAQSSEIQNDKAIWPF